MQEPTSTPSAYLTHDRLHGLTVAERNGSTLIVVSSNESPAVTRAVDNLADDIHDVTGALASIGDSASGAQIIVGTIGRSALIDEAVRTGEIDIAALRTETGELRWEGFQVTATSRALYLVGADDRGTVYAVYDLAEKMGVSPWRWWGDVPVRVREHITVRSGTAVTDWPSVKYRGVFLNDEEELDAWASRHTPDGTIGPETYRHVYELLLRLKGNYLWPAMHVGAFNHNPENGRLAHEMGVVIGTSHCDMLLRSNEHEFAPWAAAQSEPVAYDYSIEGSNRDRLVEYWCDSVAQNRDYEVTWTIGMRGVHDTGFITSAIDDDETLSEDERVRARIRLLERVIADQREILDAVLPAGRAAPQLFIPYKEVLPLYDAGLAVPDDVTIVWANDNYGYLRRYPDDAERGRSGGHGLYYHSSYWATPSTSYLATSSTPLALMKEELRKAWDHGIRTLWIDNVGGLKPLELEMEFFLRSAWEAGRETSTRDQRNQLTTWFDSTFSGGHGRRAAEIYISYYQLNNQRKLEHLESAAFPQVGYGDEAARRLGLLRQLYDSTNEIYWALPDNERDAFFELFAVKIHFTYLTNAQFVYADRSLLAYQQGKYGAADHHLELSRTFDAHKRAMIHFYNHALAGGKWQGMFTPEEFPPPVMPLLPAGKPALRIGEARLGVVAWGEHIPSPRARVVLWPEGLPAKWVEVFTGGAPGLAFIVESDPWIETSRTGGTVDTEARIGIRVPDIASHAGEVGEVRVTSTSTGESVVVEVLVREGAPPPAGFTGVYEAEGYVSIDPSFPEGETAGGETWWSRVEGLGRYGNAAMQARRAEGVGQSGGAAALSYNVLLSTAGAHLLELHRVPTLDSTGRIRVTVRLDDLPSVIVESPTTDEYRGDWAIGIIDNVERLRVPLPHLEAGPHVISLEVLDGYFTLSKLVVYTAEPRPSNLGPEFSTHSARVSAVTADPDPLDVGLAELETVRRIIYRVDPAAVPLPSQAYAGPGFWNGDTTFRRTVSRAQGALALPSFVSEPDGTKDLIRQLGSGTVLEADGVMAIEAEWVLAQSEHTFSTPSRGEAGIAWTHSQAESNGRAGLAMHVAEKGLVWSDPATAPGLHYSLDVDRGGSYRVWLLVKFDGTDDDSVALALDDVVQPPSEQFSGGSLCTYGSRQVWLWALVSELYIDRGQHVLTVFAAKSGLRLDRLYLTLGDELPPIDVGWVPSLRSNNSTRQAPLCDNTSTSRLPAGA